LAYWRYERGLVPKGPESVHLFFGKVVHEAIHVYHAEGQEAARARIEEAPWDGVEAHRLKTKERALGLFEAYVREVKRHQFEVEATEVEFEWPLTLGVWKGRWDMLARVDGMLYIVQHKTVQSWGYQVAPDLQLEAYYYVGQKVLEEKPRGVLVTLLNVRALDVRWTLRTFMEYELERWEREVEQVMDFYLRCQARGVWPRAAGACRRWWSLCPYHVLCTSDAAEEVAERLFVVDEERRDLEW